MQQESVRYNLFPLIIRFIVSEDRASFQEITKYVETQLGGKIDQNELFVALSKLIELRIVRLNEDTTGTFSLDDWKM